MASATAVSVVVPVYNSEKTLEACIQSLLDIDHPKGSMELIFVDNGSTDSTPEILKRYADKIILLSEKKRGPAAARNRGIKAATCGIIAFTDSDCVVDKSWLRELVKPLEDPAVGITGGKILAKQPCNEIEKFGEDIHDHYKALNIYKPPYAITMNWASRLSTLKEAGLFDEGLLRGEDSDLSYRICQAGYKMAYVPEAVICHENEKGLKGLFMEGFAHGFYSVQLLKKHKDLVKRAGHRRFVANDYVVILSGIFDILLRRSKISSTCATVFNLGKKIGKILGSFRFFYVEL
jgi:glycosyltransferase involved in cell wall biosynthesis